MLGVRSGYGKTRCNGVVTPGTPLLGARVIKAELSASLRFAEILEKAENARFSLFFLSAPFQLALRACSASCCAKGSRSPLMSHCNAAEMSEVSLFLR